MNDMKWKAKIFPHSTTCVRAGGLNSLPTATLLSLLCAHAAACSMRVCSLTAHTQTNAQDAYYTEQDGNGGCDGGWRNYCTTAALPYTVAASLNQVGAIVIGTPHNPNLFSLPEIGLVTIEASAEFNMAGITNFNLGEIVILPVDASLRIVAGDELAVDSRLQVANGARDEPCSKSVFRLCTCPPPLCD